MLEVESIDFTLPLMELAAVTVVTVYGNTASMPSLAHHNDAGDDGARSVQLGGASRLAINGNPSSFSK